MYYKVYSTLQKLKTNCICLLHDLSSSQSSPLPPTFQLHLEGHQLPLPAPQSRFKAMHFFIHPLWDWKFQLLGNIPQPQHSPDFMVLVPSTAGLHLKGLLLPFPDGRSCEARLPSQQQKQPAEFASLHHAVYTLLNWAFIHTYNSAYVWR